MNARLVRCSLVVPLSAALAAPQRPGPSGPAAPPGAGDRGRPRRLGGSTKVTILEGSAAVSGDVAVAIAAAARSGPETPAARDAPAAAGLTRRAARGGADPTRRPPRG